ncbi:MAG: DNA mismatch repair endonuclease MutL [Desulfobulbaceae bacterium]|nr:DNA mismatch repair endonuclease MutL [Desulfobulbaceae bacterium]
MSKIKILPENLANQIAAGEVVERPASVVKEFVENAVDAGAGRITVQVEGGGNRLIRVIDDGEGMDQDDILLCLERHATSKLQTADQLPRILTLGFRGEAIPSIASVSRLTITSRIAGAELGNRAEIRFGQLRRVHEMGCSQGTVMEVSDLFGNVPARKKFLKTARTELAHIDEIIINSALAMPQLGLTYTVDGRDIWSFAAGVDTLACRVQRIMARQLKSELIQVDGQLADLLIHGYLLPPDEAAAAAARLRIFVNRRAIRDRMITHAVAEGMHNFLMKGRRPAGAVFLELDPERVDVNVHPTKEEIRFHQSHNIHQQVVEAIGRAMQGHQRRMQHAVFGRPAAPDGNFPQSRPREQPPPPASAWQLREPSPVVQPGKTQVPLPFAASKLPEPATAGPAPPVRPAVKQAAAPPDRGEETASPLPLPGSLPGSRYRYVGQFMQSYLLCETEDGIAVIDQHAAHERLLFEQLKKQYQQLELPGQALLFPEIIECTPEQSEVLKKHGQEIARIGLVIQEFGGQSYVIKAVPAILGHLGPQEIVKGIFDHFLSREGRAKGAALRMDDMLAVMACKAAVKAHDILLPEEGEELLKKMEAAEVFSHCPHGRPVVKIFSASEIKKWFFR